ncbi:unnamed protein product [Polarella glacialis]|uniref:RRM domain-containing protein n=1 Tax=Polarella glacialis TaxID=89957 RepID=A0A813G721_POLGL|nr:unnamed protein product [Polarella glacialis]CAE8726509.1 unnamed protein product [Polarella glacialis]
MKSVATRRPDKWVWGGYRTAPEHQNAANAGQVPSNCILHNSGLSESCQVSEVKQRYLKNIRQATLSGCRFCVGGLRGLGLKQDSAALKVCLSGELNALLQDTVVDVQVKQRSGDHIDFGFLTFRSASEAKSALAEFARPGADQAEIFEIRVKDALLVVSPAAAMREGLPGSSTHTTSLRRNATGFLEAHLAAVLAKMYLDPRIGALAKTCAGSALSQDLTRALHCGLPPSFGSQAARAQYTLDRWYARVRAVFLTLLSQDPQVTALRTALFESGRDSIDVISFGGGPGFDVAALAFVAAFLGTRTKVRCTVFDSEPGWEEVFTALVSHVDARLSESSGGIDGPILPLGLSSVCDFQTCDISVPLAHPTNSRLAASIHSGVDLGIFSYVVHENEALLRKPGTPVDEGVAGIFPELFEGLSKQSCAGHSAALIFLDSTPRLWPALAATARPHGLEAFIPDILRGRCKLREPLVLLARGPAGGRSSDEAEATATHQLPQLERHESYLAAADRKRSGLAVPGLETRAHPLSDELADGAVATASS